VADRTATTAEVAEVLHLSPATVQLYAREGRIPFDRTPGGHRRYNIAEVQLALAPADDVEDVTIELGRPRARGLGRGVPAPTSANAALLRGLRAARPEPRPQPVKDAEAGGSSALSSLVAHAKRVKLATVSA